MDNDGLKGKYKDLFNGAEDNPPANGWDRIEADLNAERRRPIMWILPIAFVIIGLVSWLFWPQPSTELASNSKSEKGNLPNTYVQSVEPEIDENIKPNLASSSENRTSETIADKLQKVDGENINHSQATNSDSDISNKKKSTSRPLTVAGRLVLPKKPLLFASNRNVRGKKSRLNQFSGLEGSYFAGSPNYFEGIEAKHYSNSGLIAEVKQSIDQQIVDNIPTLAAPDYVNGPIDSTEKLETTKTNPIKSHWQLMTWGNFFYLANATSVNKNDEFLLKPSSNSANPIKDYGLQLGLGLNRSFRRWDVSLGATYSLMRTEREWNMAVMQCGTSQVEQINATQFVVTPNVQVNEFKLSKVTNAHFAGIELATRYRFSDQGRFFVHGAMGYNFLLGTTTKSAGDMPTAFLWEQLSNSSSFSFGPGFKVGKSLSVEPSYNVFLSSSNEQAGFQTKTKGFGARIRYVFK